MPKLNRAATPAPTPTAPAPAAVPLAKEPTYDPAVFNDHPPDAVSEHMDGVNAAFYEMLEFSVICWSVTQIKRIALNEDLTDEEGGRLFREFTERVNGLVKVHGLPIVTLSDEPTSLHFIVDAAKAAKAHRG